MRQRQVSFQYLPQIQYISESSGKTLRGRYWSTILEVSLSLCFCITHSGDPPLIRWICIIHWRDISTMPGKMVLLIATKTLPLRILPRLIILSVGAIMIHSHTTSKVIVWPFFTINIVAVLSLISVSICRRGMKLRKRSANFSTSPISLDREQIQSGIHEQSLIAHGSKLLSIHRSRIFSSR